MQIGSGVHLDEPLPSVVHNLSLVWVLDVPNTVTQGTREFDACEEVVSE